MNNEIVELTEFPTLATSLPPALPPKLKKMTDNSIQEPIYDTPPITHFVNPHDSSTTSQLSTKEDFQTITKGIIPSGIYISSPSSQSQTSSNTNLSTTPQPLETFGIKTKVPPFKSHILSNDSSSATISTPITPVVTPITPFVIPQKIHEEFSQMNITLPIQDPTPPISSTIEVITLSPTDFGQFNQTTQIPIDNITFEDIPLNDFPTSASNDIDLQTVDPAQTTHCSGQKVLDFLIMGLVASILTCLILKGMVAFPKFGFIT